MNIFRRWKLRSLVAASRTDDAIAYLRSLGLSKGESAIALNKVGMESGTAKLAVHASPVWRDRHAADAAFHESLEHAVDGLQADGEADDQSRREARTCPHSATGAASEVLVEFVDPQGREVVRRAAASRDLPDALRQLQKDYPGLNFLVDIRASGRERLSVVLAGQEGMAILWRDRPLRTLGDASRTGRVHVWDGAGVEMPARQFISLSILMAAIEGWLATGHWAASVHWVPEE